MAITPFLTDVFALLVSENDGSTFLTVSGLNNLTMDETAADVDTTTFDNTGWSSAMPGMKSGSVEAAGLRLADGTTGARDAGQKAVEKAARSQGYAVRRKYRIAWKDAPETHYIQFYGYAKLGQFGGGLNTAVPWSVTISLDGAPVYEGALFDSDS